MKAIYAVLAALLAAVLAPSPAEAVSPGDQLRCYNISFVTCSRSLATVGDGVEFTINTGTPLLAFDFATNLVTISNISGNQLRFASCCGTRFANESNPFTAVAFQSATGVTDLNGGALPSGQIRFDNGFFGITLDGMRFAAGGQLVVRLESAAPAGVPEPAGWAAMIAGMGLCGGALRRRRARAAIA